MGFPLPIKSVKAGDPGSPFKVVLTFTAKAIGNYVINETNFPGIGAFLPGWVAVASGTPANADVEISTDNGTTWKSMEGGGGFFFVDTATTIRIAIITAATDIFLFPLG